MGPLTRLVSWLVPAAWRVTVVRDLIEESRRSQRGVRADLWAAMQTARIGLAFRWRGLAGVSGARRPRALARRRGAIVTGSMRDVRFAWRTLRRTPWFTLTAVLALTVGIGAATTVFSVADGVLFRPLPYRESDRLVSVGADIRSRGQTHWAVYAGEFDAWRAASRTLADLAGWQTFGRFTLSLPGEPVEVNASRITENFLTLLGVAPVHGRAFNDADFKLNATPVLLLTDDTWRRHFSRNPDVIGSSIAMNGASAVIAGVLPESFVFPTTYLRAPEILVPLVRTAESTASSRLSLIGRLADGRTIDDAAAEIDAIAAARKGESGLRNAPIDGASVEDLSAFLSTNPRLVLLLLVGAVAALLLIGCVNVANLLLARGADRRPELALRRALGASSAALMRLLLTEAVLLAGAGAVLGSVVAFWTVNAIRPLIPPDLERFGPIAVDARALVFAALAAAVCVVVAALGPAGGVTGRSMAPAMAAHARTTSGGVSARRVLIGVEVALAVVLLVGAGLMVHTMIRLLRVDTGYGAADALTMRVQLPRGKTFPQRSREFVTRTLEAARSVPGVVAAGATQNPPLDNTLYGGHYIVEGFTSEWIEERVKSDVSDGGPCCTQTQYVSSDYFDAAEIPVLAGRRFTPSDATASERVAMISERLANLLPREIAAVGHHLVAFGTPSDRRRIVGVVRDVRDVAVDRRALPAIYLPLEERGTSAMTLVVRSGLDPRALAHPVREAVQKAAGPVVVSEVMTIGERIAKSTGGRRLNAWLFGAFGVAALTLTAIGIGGVIAYAVAKRTREIGVRLALGATPAAVRRQLVRESLWPVGAGVAVGTGGAWVLSQFAARYLYEITSRDLATYAAVIAILLGAALAAAYLPARRAARVDPSLALRSE